MGGKMGREARVRSRSNARNKRQMKFQGSKATVLTISEAAKAVECWHFDDKGKEIVYEGVEGFVAEHPPREMGHRLQFIVDE